MLSEAFIKFHRDIILWNNERELWEYLFYFAIRNTVFCCVNDLLIFTEHTQADTAHSVFLHLQAHLREAKCHMALGSVEQATKSLDKLKEIDSTNSQYIAEVCMQPI